MNIKLNNRRYIGSKFSILDWIFDIINSECKGSSFFDIFSGTGVVSAKAAYYFKDLIINDFLYSNEVILNSFFYKKKYNKDKVNQFLKKYNSIDEKKLKENYFSINFGNKFFSNSLAKKIGYIREDLEINKNVLSSIEYKILLTSLIFSADKVANTVGHYDAYIKKEINDKELILNSLDHIKFGSVKIYRNDANKLVKKINCDVAYIDPPYNSRQYSRFYHILENLTKWEKPILSGVAMKPPLENMSNYCRVSAKNAFNDLISNINAKYIVTSYNNTYASKSSSSENKIKLDEIMKILNRKGKTKSFSKPYRHFNSGKTEFKDHKEFLFITKVKT